MASERRKRRRTNKGLKLCTKLINSVKLLFENWREFKTLTLEKQILQEVSEEYAERIQDWFAASGGQMALPFSDMFNGEMREVISLGPIVSPRSTIGKMIDFFKRNGYEVDFANGLITKEVATQKGTQTRKQKIGKALQQVLRLKKTAYNAGDNLDAVHKKIQDASAEYVPRAEIELSPEVKKATEDWKKANSNLAKTFPREVLQSDLEEFIDFWNKKSTFYRENPEKAQTEYSIIISRHPIDVLRMSDFAMIHSCHSEGSDYFYCALSEARGHGPVAYVVETNDLQEINLADDEIFEDDDRGIEGIEPIARLRLRRFNNENKDFDLAIPEAKVYGVSIPDFQKKLKAWALDKQKDKFQYAIKNNQIDEDFMNEFLRMGGSYQSDVDRSMSYQMFNDFFSDYNPSFRGNVKWVGDEHEEEEDPYLHNQQLAEEFEEAGANVEDWVSNNLEHSYFSYEVMHEDEEEEPQLFFNGGMSFDFELDGPEADNFPDWRGQTELANKINSELDTYNGASDYDVSEYQNTLTYRIEWETGWDYDMTPDGADNFSESMKQDDEDYEKHRAAIKSVLVEEGYVIPTQVDILRKRFEEGEIEFEHFDIEKSDEGGWEIVTTELGLVGPIKNDPWDVFKAVYGKGKWSPIGKRNFSSSAFSRQVIDSMSSEMIRAIKDSAKQLELAFGDEQLELPINVKTTPQKVEDYILDGFVLILRKIEALDAWTKVKEYGKGTPRKVGIEKLIFALDDDMDPATINSAVNLIKHIDKNIGEFKDRVTDTLQMNDAEYEKVTVKGKKELEYLTKIANEIVNYKANINYYLQSSRGGKLEHRMATIFLNRLGSTEIKQAILDQEMDPSDEQWKDFIKLINTIKKIHKKLDKTKKISENIRRTAIKIRTKKSGKVTR